MKKKFNFKQILVLIWMGVSFYGVMIVSEGPFWLMASIVASFGLSVYVAKRMNWKGTEIDNEEV